MNQDRAKHFGFVFGKMLSKEVSEHGGRKKIVYECARTLAAFASADATPGDVAEFHEELERGIKDGRESFQAFMRRATS